MAYYDNYTKEEKKKLAKGKVSKALFKINSDVASIFNNNSFSNYLKFAANFHYFDVNNTILIYKQKPDAEFLASFKVWEKLSIDYWGDPNQPVFLSSQKGKGIGVLAPYILKKTLDTPAGQETLGVSYLDYHVVFVFDKTQVNNIPVPTTSWDLDKNTNDCAALFSALKEKSPFNIVFSDENPPSSRYVFETGQPGTEDVLVMNSKDKNNFYLLCTYIVKPFVLRSLEKVFKKLPSADVQKISECAAFMVASYFGLPVDDYIFFFVEQWGENKKDKEMSILKNIQGSAHWLIDMLEEEMIFYKSTHDNNEFFDNNDIFEFNTSFGF